MSKTGSLLVFLSDPRVAPYATGDVPLWLWSADATRVLWGNPAAAAIFHAASPRALTGHTIDPKGTAALQIARLAGSLPYGAAPRLERLRGFGGRIGGALMCACSRIVLPDRTPTILVVATEKAGPSLSLHEQARRLLSGYDEALALFAPDGALLHATPAASERLAGIQSLAAIGAAQVAAAAFAGGRAEHRSEAGKIALYRIGTDAATLLLADIEGQAPAAAAQPPATSNHEIAALQTSPAAEPIAAAEAAVPPPEPLAPPMPVPDPAPQPASREAVPFYQLVTDSPIFAPLSKLAAATAKPALVTLADPPAASPPPRAADLATTPPIPPPDAQASAPSPPATQAADASERPSQPGPVEIADGAAAAPTPPTTPPRQLAGQPDLPAEDNVAATAEPEFSEPQRRAAQAIAARRQPLRFVWQLDAEGHFTLSSEEFVALIGPATAAALGRTWDLVSKALRLDPAGQVARAFASRNTWSGITVSFPLDGTDLRLPVELSGLPVFDRDRNFRGYRGFGICRSIDRIAEIGAVGPRPAAAESAAAETEAEASGRPAAATDLAPEQPAQPAAVPAAAATTASEPAAKTSPSSAEPPVFRDEPPPEPGPLAVNVVPFRSPAPIVSTAAPQDEPPALTPVERNAFTELASRLTARLRDSKDKPAAADDREVGPASAPLVAERRERPGDREPSRASEPRPILDRLPVGVLVYRLDQLIYANRAFLDWTGYSDLYALQDAGGLDALFVEPGPDDGGSEAGSQSLTIATNRGDKLPVEARLFSAPWEGESALVLMLTGAVAPAANAAPSPPTAAPQPASPSADAEIEPRLDAAQAALRGARAEVREARAMLALAADGIVMLDRDANVLWINRGAQGLFGYPKRDAAGLPFATLFAPDSQAAVLQLLKSSDPAKPRGLEVIGRRRDGTLVPLFMTAGPINNGHDRFCAVFRDISPWKKTEGELMNARRIAERASSVKSDFLAKVSHEIRTPLNAIIGFAEVMMQERFGPIGNERYRQYLKDIHVSGDYLLSLLNDLLDLSKIEAGKLELNFTSVHLNELIEQTVSLLQPQANRERIIIRTSLAVGVPPVTADARSVRQILLNLLSNSIKFTGAGGQIIVSTAVAADGNVVLRVRDTGIGMSEQDIAIALEPFRQLATSARFGSGGTGLGLPLTKALAEANRASFTIKSAVNTGTLVEVAFPIQRLAAE